MKSIEFERLLHLSLPVGQSAFLWGARNTGKSTFLHKHYPDAICYDLLKTDQLTRLLAQPHLLREELLAVSAHSLQYPVIIDEIQKIPMLLDEVHWLIESKKIGFILCGSSARKLKRGAANLLGGRAWNFMFYPLVYKEIPHFDLLRALNHGLLPTHYLTDQPVRALRAYIHNYLKEEIQAEGIVRNLPGFARFLDVVGFSHGEMINYTNIARDCAIDAKTVKAYYQILADTLIGYLIMPFFKKAKRQLIESTPKFYLFDVGVANYLGKRTIQTLKGVEAGNAFEHFILMEIIAFLGIHELDIPINYWRSKTGMEVDFILNEGEMAVEVKIDNNPILSDAAGLSAFCDDYNPKHSIIVCQSPKKRQVQTKQGHSVDILPWKDFLENLWDRKYF
jgi:predicted AAA+ superfamily ATPase